MSERWTSALRWRRAGRWTAGLAVAAAAAGAVAQDPPDRQARVWAASCASCHGTDGATRGGVVPTLAGRSADELYRALSEFKAGQRPAASVMHQHAKGYAEDELRRIAAYFAAQDPTAGARR